MDKKNVIRQYAVGGALAIILFLAGVFSQGLLQQTDTAEFLGTLSDCFLFPAVFLGGIGALTWIAEMGNFDMLSYGFYFTFHRLFHPLTAHESFYDYKMRKGKEQGAWLKHWLIIGLFCFAASALCLLLWIVL
ncbi:MAG: DUF3899 domain-containing protein [Butyrivibrio sp.]|nr:DUF3899 domain-containing protein [Butyrivibrio sp.]